MPRLPPQVETTLFRIVQEALNNVAKHAQAEQVMIVVDGMKILPAYNPGRWKGFDLSSRDGSDQPSHWGLLTMQERAIAVGGKLIIESKPVKVRKLSLK